MESPADLEGFPEMKEAEKEEVKGLIEEFVSLRPSTKRAGASKAAAEPPVKVADEGAARADSLPNVGKNLSHPQS